jgi:hypothetical protein
MLTTKKTKTSPAPQLFYRFEITGDNGETYPVIISEDGLFLSEASKETFDQQLDAVPQH